MTERRELEGIGYHYYDGNDDCLLVSQWIRRPDDLTGQSVPVSKLLPRGVRCVNPESHYSSPAGVSGGNPPMVTFRFRILVEIENVNANPK